MASAQVVETSSLTTGLVRPPITQMIFFTNSIIRTAEEGSPQMTQKHMFIVFAFFCFFSFKQYFLQRRGLGPLLCYVMGLNESNHFSGLTSAFRAAYEQSNFKSRANFGLRSAYELKSRANFGLRSAYEHKSIYISRPCARSRSRVWWRVKEFKKGEFFSLCDNVFKLFCA